MKRFSICILSWLICLLFSNPCCYSFQMDSKVIIEDDDPNAGMTFESLYREYMVSVKNPLVIDSMKIVNNLPIKVYAKCYANKAKPKLMPKRLIFFKDGKRFKVFMFNLDINIDFGNGRKIQKAITNADIEKAFPDYDEDYFTFGRISYISIEKMLEYRLILGLNFSIPLTDLGYFFYLTIDKNGKILFSDKPAD